MDNFLIQFWQTLMSQAGVIAVMLAMATVYQTKKLNEERKKNDNLNAQVLTLATSQITSTNELTTVLKGVISFTANGKD